MFSFARTFIFFTLLTFTCFTACNQPASKNIAEKTTAAENLPQETPSPSDATATITVTAKFSDFVLGDAEHYIFTDEDGRELDFAGCEAPGINFSAELPEEEINETNQGWGTNKSLQNKWFTIHYITRKQPLYQDGPEGDVNIIVKAEEIPAPSGN